MHFERRLPEILETTNFVHFFAGMSVSGFRIDCNTSVNPNLVANVENTPLADSSFDGGMADPPYTAEFAKNLYKTEYPKWAKWTKELVRLVKPGGRIAIMQNYIVPRLPNCDMEEIVIILLRIKQYPKIVTVQRKRLAA
jgi:predicted methyltransferase